MVSNASEDLPDPLNPVITVRVLRGISTLMFFRLCCRAPLTLMFVIPMRCFYRIPKDLGAPPYRPFLAIGWVGSRGCPILSFFGKGWDQRPLPSRGACPRREGGNQCGGTRPSSRNPSLIALASPSEGRESSTPVSYLPITISVNALEGIGLAVGRRVSQLGFIRLAPTER